MGKYYLVKLVATVFAFCIATALASSAQSFKTLADFNTTNGSSPVMPVVQGIDGNFYGTTPLGGTNINCPTAFGGPIPCGTVFKITPAGKLTTLYSFCPEKPCPDGRTPEPGLIQAADGNLYGTTQFGGFTDSNFCLYGCGTVFKITPTGKLTTLHKFNYKDGFSAYGLIQNADGNFYGASAVGGAVGYGTIFKITPAGKLTSLHNFNYSDDGAYPNEGLAQAPNGDLYGTTGNGGANIAGTVFKITPTGVLTTLYNFCSQASCADGQYPIAGLVRAANGNFYGTTGNGGIIGNNCPNSYGCGTAFKVTAAGALTTLYKFCDQANCTDGVGPSGSLMQATDGKLYGATLAGGANFTSCDNFGIPGCGTIFNITPNGNVSIRHSFDGTDGEAPYGVPTQGTDGTFYGAATEGGVNGVGTAFRLSLGLAPFVETLSTSGKVGTQVFILGNNLTGTTRVAFHGTAAKFTLISNSEIKATVPQGATTGKIAVTTPKNTLKSNLPFRVIQ